MELALKISGCITLFGRGPRGVGKGTILYNFEYLPNKELNCVFYSYIYLSHLVLDGTRNLTIIRIGLRKITRRGKLATF